MSPAHPRGGYTPPPPAAVRVCICGFPPHVSFEIKANGCSNCSWRFKSSIRTNNPHHPAEADQSSIFERTVSGISWPWDGCPKPRQQLVQSWGGPTSPAAVAALSSGWGWVTPPRGGSSSQFQSVGGTPPPVGSTVFGGGGLRPSAGELGTYQNPS